jgi:hypothetical protein
MNDECPGLAECCPPRRPNSGLLPALTPRVKAAGVEVAVWVTAATRAAVLTAYAPAYTRTHPTVGDAGAAEEYWRGRAGDPAGAVATLEDLVAAMVRVLGPNHPDTQKTQHNLAYWRRQTGDAAEPDC